MNTHSPIEILKSSIELLRGLLLPRPKRKSKHFRRHTLKIIRTSQSREEAIERVAQELYRDSVAQGGSVMDLGVWGPSLYRQEAQQLVDELIVDNPSTDSQGNPFKSGV